MSRIYKHKTTFNDWTQVIKTKFRNWET